MYLDCIQRCQCKYFYRFVLQLNFVKKDLPIYATACGFDYRLGKILYFNFLHSGYEAKKRIDGLVPSLLHAMTQKPNPETECLNA